MAIFFKNFFIYFMPFINFKFGKTTLESYANKYATKKLWDKGHRERGYYLPEFTTYKWEWGIKLSLKN
jgi:hypothetical protein